jgi:integrase
MKNAGNKQRAARISANSFLRRAKALFAPSMTKHLERVTFLPPRPFEGVEFYNRTSMRYHSSFDVLKLIKTSKKELAPSAPEQFKVFLLAVMAGLRRREIDTLEWSAFRWDSGIIRIQPTKWFHPKSEDSIGDVEIDPELVEVFREYHGKAKSHHAILFGQEETGDKRFRSAAEGWKAHGQGQGLGGEIIVQTVGVTPGQFRISARKA